MSKLRRALLAAVALVGTAGTAAAADLYGSSKDTYMPAIAYGPSWYVRGDVAWAHYDKPEMWENGIWKLTETEIDRNFAFGGGIGHYFTRNVRGDVTFEYRKETDFSGNIADPLNDIPGKRKFGVQSNVIMANLYYDFNAGGRVMPYIGAGLGAVHHKVKDGTVEPICGCPGTIDGDSNWSVAGALMAGVSINLLGAREPVMRGMKDDPVPVASNRGLYLDIGYRFMYLGDTATGPVRGPATNPVSHDPSVDGIHAHELRLGLRYDFR